MAAPLVDWESLETSIFLNPRLPQADRQRIHDQLKAFELPGHLWLTTSGTSGKFKCAALSKQAFLASAAAVNTHYQLNEKDIWIHCLPDFHVGGLGIYARSHLSGAKVIKMPAWDANVFAQLAAARAATVSALVPTQLYDLVHLGAKAPGAYRMTMIGGGALSQELFDLSWKLGWNAVPSYGMTECASQVAAAAPGTYGPLLPLNRVKLCIKEKRIAIQSPSLLSGYAYQGLKTAKWKDPKQEAWFVTEDCGRLENGCLQVLGRGTDFIKIKGESVNLSELQLKLEACKTDAKLRSLMAIVPVPDARAGFQLHLVVEGMDEQVEALVSRYQAAVLPFERITKVHRLDAIPQTPLGKIQLKKIMIDINNGGF